MTPYEKLKKIMVDNRLGVREFIEKTSIPTGTFYKIKNGETDKVTHRTAQKINKAFPDYSYEWLISMNANNTEVKQSEVNSTLDEMDSLAQKVMDNWEELSKKEKFKGFFYYKVAQVLNMDIDKIFADAVSKGQ
ncbi:helix-turn-helix domain-containing protein [Aquimarina sp. 2-A2]|uniref:helix-turn-helix domain-containing protein n=1 Tax=Aquimarina sp. 2-A2 TaxID=3382644 RepID=UPI00387F13D0